jgi:hypothetical protein
LSKIAFLETSWHGREEVRLIPLSETHNRPGSLAAAELRPRPQILSVANSENHPAMGV